MLAEAYRKQGETLPVGALPSAYKLFGDALNLQRGMELVTSLGSPPPPPTPSPIAGMNMAAGFDPLRLPGQMYPAGFPVPHGLPPHPNILHPQAAAAHPIPQHPVIPTSPVPTSSSSAFPHHTHPSPAALHGMASAPSIRGNVSMPPVSSPAPVVDKTELARTAAADIIRGESAGHKRHEVGVTTATSHSSSTPSPTGHPAHCHCVQCLIAPKMSST